MITSALLQFLKDSPTPFHATKNLSKLLLQAGFHALDDSDVWNLERGKGYFYSRSGSAFVAFIYGENATEHGIRFMGAHTDSPCLKVKPTPDVLQQGFHQLGVEVYGGALLAPWFDRDLSLAGRVSYVTAKNELRHQVVDLLKPIAVIPSLAIHLDRDANKNRSINPQTDMSAILSLSTEKQNVHQWLADDVISDNECHKVLDYNLSFYDTAAPALVGLHEEFIASARLDNLLSCFVGAQALLDANTQYTSVLIFNDHEEVGSRSSVGAQGPLLTEMLERLIPNSVSRQQALRRSLMLSVDNAHGVHPNFSDKHDPHHAPKINGGPVLKFDVNQSYATSSDSAAVVRMLAGDSIPLQNFSIRADMRCGSTIGPITSAQIGVNTVDIGVPTFAMHSIRELAGVKDVEYLHQLLERFFLCESFA